MRLDEQMRKYWKFNCLVLNIGLLSQKESRLPSIMFAGAFAVKLRDSFKIWHHWITTCYCSWTWNQPMVNGRGIHRIPNNRAPNHQFFSFAEKNVSVSSTPFLKKRQPIDFPLTSLGRPLGGKRCQVAGGDFPWYFSRILNDCRV